MDGEYLTIISPKKEDKGKWISQASMNDPRGVARVFSGIDRRMKAARRSKKK